MSSEFQNLEVESVDFDTGNPRIKKALEKYGDQITAERISFALKTASDDVSATSSFTKLRDSIRANGRITQPITVALSDETLTCIDGNTRLAIYKEFLQEETDGKWNLIPAIVIENANQKDIETIRVSAHLVGPREWPAYEKARYLHYLYHQEFLEFSEMVILCGGNQRDIEEQIGAYEDMNTYYRDLVDDTAFHIDRFSGFVELQSRKVKESIFEAGYDLKDFGEWIRDGKIRRLRDVRQLPKVLADEETKTEFVTGGVGSIEKAISTLDYKKREKQKIDPEKATLGNSSIAELATELSTRISQIPFNSIMALQDSSSESDKETLLALEDLSDKLDELLSHVGKR